MKKVIILFTIAALPFMAMAQKKAAKKSSASKSSQPSTASTTVLKSLADSASYALGYNIAHSIQKDLGDLNTAIVLRAITDAFANKPTVFDEEKSKSIFTTYAAQIKEKKAASTIESSTAFLAKNKLRPGVKTTASGLQYEVLKEASGAKPAATDTVICHYSGSLIDGTVFDESYTRHEPLTIPLQNVIKAWTEGVPLMSKGAKYKFYIPYQLGYGLRGAPPTIPGGAALIFEIELLDFKKAL